MSQEMLNGLAILYIENSILESNFEIVIHDFAFYSMKPFLMNVFIFLEWLLAAFFIFKRIYVMV